MHAYSAKITKICNFASDMVNVLYIHGMGGGADSRIPSILQENLFPYGVNVVARTYDFDPEVAAVQILSWVDELKPSLVIGESLGSLHAIRVRGVPHLFVSPALNTPVYFYVLAWLTLIPGVTRIFDRIYRPREGDRQPLHFSFGTLRKYPAHRVAALANSIKSGSEDYFHAFFGTRDHYRRSGIVSIRTWKKYFGDSFSVYDGTHFMEEEFVYSLLIPAILNLLDINE